MCNLLNDTKRSVKNKWFIVACAMGVILSVISAASSVKGYSEFSGDLQITEYNPLNPLNSLFTFWLGSGVRTKLIDVVLMFVPLLAALPYSWSLCHEKKKGIAEERINDQGELRYYTGKYIAVFVSSGAVIAIIQLLNLLINSLFIPAITPDPAYDIYFGVFSSHFLGDMFYTMPVLYELIFVMFSFILGGLIGCFGCAAGAVLRSRVAAVIIPGALFIAVELLKNKIVDETKEISPITFIGSASVLFDNISIALIEMAFLFIFSFIIIVLGNLKKEKPAVGISTGSLEMIGE